MEYSNYETEDFLTDEDFKRWVLHPTAHSTKYWQSVSMDDEQMQAKMKKARHLILQLDFVHLEPSEEEISSTLSKVLNASGNGVKLSDRKQSNKTYYAIAATVSILLAIGFVFFKRIDSSDTPLTSQVIVKENPMGQRSQTFLPDGTKVWLHANSRLTYSIPFTDSIRFVKITGEAFFEVAKDPEHPFVVESQLLKIVALGTAFNVFSRENSEKISLVEGKVSVDTRESGLDQVILEPGESGKYSDQDPKIEKGTFTPGEIAWIDGTLNFDNASFDEMLKMLSTWYGVEFDVEGRRPAKTVSGQFSNQNLENVLTTIGFTYEFDFKIKDKKVSLTFKEQPM
ncbi:MAG: DUF4974 domain-containing protein [Cyclobacteriaceae bacterium]|nr:DUF4974 domain-containing protein [Cyclobacteriaceae bacterium SS2]